MNFWSYKISLCMCKSADPFVEKCNFHKVPYISRLRDFMDIYLTHLRTRISSPQIHIHIRKWFFWTPKDCCPPWAGAKKTLSSTLNVMISQMVRNESLRFDRHIDIEVSYKILQLDAPKHGPCLHILCCFQKGLF
jgi:hypothetical protein